MVDRGVESMSWSTNPEANEVVNELRAKILLIWRDKESTIWLKLRDVVVLYTFSMNYYKCTLYFKSRM